MARTFSADSLLTTLMWERRLPFDNNPPNTMVRS